MNNDLVTVIVAAYNHENYIEETIKSIIEQTYQNIELVLIDDGSKDKTFEKVLAMKPQLEKRFVNVHIEKQKNIGSAQTINKLAQIANGEYLYMIASDDVALPNAVEKLYEFLSKNKDFGLVAGDSTMIDQNSKPVLMDENREIVSKKSIQAFKTYNDYNTERLFRLYGKKINCQYNWANLDYIDYYNHWFENAIPQGYLVKKDVFKKIEKFSVNSPLEDVFFHFQITKFYKEKVLPDILFHYRLHPTNSMKNTDRILKIAKITRMYELYLLDTKYPQFKSKKLENSWWYMTHKKEWDKSKNSPLWDEQYYVNKYPEIVEAGWIPLVHYLTEGKEKGFLPSKYFEHPLHRVRKGCNMLCRKKKNIIKRLKFKQRFKIASYGILLVLAQIPLLDVLLSRKVRNILGKKISKYWR